MSKVLKLLHRLKVQGINPVAGKDQILFESTDKKISADLQQQIDDLDIELQTLFTSVTFWQEIVPFVSERVQLPVYPPVDESRSELQKRYDWQLDGSLWNNIKQQCKSEGVNPGTWLLSAWQLLLHKYSGQKDLCVAVQDAAPLMTKMVVKSSDDSTSNLPLIAQIDSSKKLSEQLQSNTDALIIGAQHTHFNLAQINTVTQLGNYSGLTQFGFSFSKAGISNEQPLTADFGFLRNCGQQFELSLELLENADGLDCYLHLDTQLYHHQWCEKLAQRFSHLVAQMLAKPQAKIADLSIFNDDDTQQVLRDFNQSGMEYPTEACLHQLFVAQAKRTPDSVAIRCEEQQLTYSELLNKSSILAAYLQKQGVGPDTLVGFCLPRTEQLLVAILGIMQAGGAYVPLDPNYPQGRLQHIHDDSQIKLLLTEQSLLEQCLSISGEQTNTLCLDKDWSKIAKEAGDTKVQELAESHHLAYIIYTSGSTGKPKGVAIEHRNAAAMLHWAANQYSQSEYAGVMAATSVCFDLSIYEMFLPLSYGGEVIMMANALALVDSVNRHRVTLINTVPSAAEELLANNAIGDGVVTINLAGEPLSVDLVDRLYQNTSVTKVYDLYGPSEDTTYSTCMLRQEQGVESIGRPIDNTSAYVLDRQQQPVAVGIPGELYLSGAGVARGYLYRAEQTEQKFIPDPFVKGQRMYGTGDLVVWNEDGTLKYLGRIDTQVKIRGFRIEVREIEARLTDIEGVNDAVVVVQGAGSSKRLVAFVVTGSATALNVDDLRQQLSAFVPDYMVPSAWQFIDQIPLTPNGKIDRKQLTDTKVALQSTQEYVAPANDLEAELVDIWSQVLKVPADKIGVNDSFFELGGNSLSATQIFSRVAKTHSIKFPVRVMFSHSTIRQLAEYINVADGQSIDSIKVLPRKSGQDFVLSYAQERLWVLRQIEQNDTSYHIPLAFTYSGKLNVNQLEQALNQIVARHESLRTIFVNEKGRARQKILPDMTVRLAYSDISDENGQQAMLLERLCRDDVSRAFDLTQGPLLRARVVKQDKEQYLILITLHHIISDGWSLAVLVDELSHLMAGNKLPDLAVQYVDFSQWQRNFMEEQGALEEQLDYWKGKLKGVTQSLDLATDFPRGSERDYRGSQVDFTISAKLHNQLEILAEDSGATLYMVLMAIVKVLLMRHSGQSDICVGSPIANRQHAETESLIGMFVNTLAIRDLVEPQASFTNLLQQVKQTCLEAWEHQDAPFERVVDALQVERNMALNPLFQVMMVLQNTPNEGIEQTNQSGSFASKLTPWPVKSELSKFDLTFEFTEIASGQAKGLQCRIEFCRGLYKTETISRMAAQLQRLCELIVAAPDKAINQHQYLPEDELLLVTESFNDTKAPFPQDKCIHELFLENAQANPDHIAVRDEQGQLTYGELAKRSETLARYLQSQGVGKDILVGLYLSRSVDMMVAMLGIMRSGGAYVPLDPDYPEARLQHMVSDSGCQLVLSQSWHQQDLETLIPENCSVLHLDTDWQDIEQQVATTDKPLLQLSGPQDMIYVIYTSGSTGKPKGVMLEHRSVLNKLWWRQKHYGLNADDILLQKTPYSFDVSVWEFFWPMIAGAQTVFARPGGHSDVTYLCDFVNQYGVTVLHFVPSLLNIFLDYAPETCPGVRYTYSSGEALNKKATLEYSKVFPNGQLHNLYGPTEGAIEVTYYDCQDVPGSTVPIGKPIDNIQIYLLDELLQPVPVGVPGELHIAGAGVARGYLNREELTAEKFIVDPFASSDGKVHKMYKSGDLARWLDDGNIEYMGRIDTQVKLRGFRIEIGEIEAQMLAHDKVQDAAVVLQGSGNNKSLVGFYVIDETDTVSTAELKAHLSENLPSFMLPTFLQRLESMPITPNGKADRKALVATPVLHDKQQEPQNVSADLAATNPTDSSTEKAQTSVKPNVQQRVLTIWCEVLGRPAGSIGMQDNIFEIGGNSISVIELATRLQTELKVPVNPSLLFKYSNVATLTDYLTSFGEYKQNSVAHGTEGAVSSDVEQAGAATAQVNQPHVAGSIPDYYDNSLAIVGMSCHLASANNRWQFWQKLLDGEECINHLSKEEARMAGVPESILDAPRFVPMSWWMEGKEYFDPEFFKISSGNAALMDPQYRQLLMHSWRAVEDAGYVPADIKNTSVYMTAGNNFYQSLLHSLQTQGHVLANSEEFITWLMAQGGTIPTMVSFQLGLTGAAVYVHSNCSSAISGLYAASQSILSGDSEFAMVGAASLSSVKSLGYLYQPGLNLSSDGHIKTFDASADGMVEGEGVGVVLVRKASEAIKAGDNIYAVIRGVGLNNDGNEKAGFYAPSVNGQAELIRQTLDKSGVAADSINYIEAHGTGTSLGDPIEVMALTQAFASVTNKKQFCGLGSVKPNIGHLDSAAGIAGLIKLALSLHHKTHPALINYHQPNEQIDFANSPFYVQDKNKVWQDDAPLQRAAISSFGIGGTNGHAILEEYRKPQLAGASSEPQLVVLSAQKADVLQEYCESLQAFLKNPEAQQLDISDIAFTLQTGRVAMEHRVAFVAQDKTQLRDTISAYLQGEQSDDIAPQWYEGNTLKTAMRIKLLAQDEDYQKLLQDWLRKRKVERLGELWVRGLDVDWMKLHQGRSLRRVSLPTYPFAKQAIWIDESNSSTAQLVRSTGVADIHPLVHKNNSNLSQQRYVSSFTGKEFFLSDHVIAGQRILPAVAYLEMVRAAVQDALPGLNSNDVVRLHDIVWIAPVVVLTELDVSVVLQINAREGLDFTVSTEVEGESVIHCQGAVTIGERPAVQIIQSAQLASQTQSAELDVAAIYGAFEKLGTQFGPAFRALTGLQQSEDQVLGRIVLPEHLAPSAHEYQLHPSIMDAALQACTLLIAGAGNLPTEATLPFAMQQISVLRPVRPESMVRVRFSQGSSADDKMVKMDVDILDSEGTVCIQIHGFSVRKMAKHNIGLYSAVNTWQGLAELPTCGSGIDSQRHLLLFDISAEQFPEMPDTFMHRLTLPESQTSAVRYQAAAEALLQQLKKLLLSRNQQKVLLQVVLPVAQSELDCAGLIGMIKSACLENPRIKGQLLLIGQDKVTKHLKSSLQQLAESGVSTAYRLGEDALQAQFWQPVSMPEALPPLPFRDNGCYLITGGTGALAQLFAKHIIEQTSQAKVLLTGRSASNARIRKQLSGLGERASYIKLDLTNNSEVQKVLTQQSSELGDICGVLHCAGMIADNFVIKKTEDELRAVFAPKVSGTENLDQACRNMKLDFMALFSSESSLGSMGQADYAAANGFMNDFANWRNQRVYKGERHGHTVAICWPYWEQGGMELDAGTLASITDETGMMAMSSESGLNAFSYALSQPQGQILFIEGHLDKIRRYVEQTNAEPALKAPAKQQAIPASSGVTPVVSAPAVKEQAPVAPAHSSTTVTANTESGRDIKRQAVEYLQQQLATVFKLPASDIDANSALENYGIDSILAINLTNHLETIFGALSKTLFFEYQNVSELADYFVENHQDTLVEILGAEQVTDNANNAEQAQASEPQQEQVDGAAQNAKVKPISSRFSAAAGLPAATSATSTIPVKTASVIDDDIAIIGLSGRYPEAIDVQQYWDNLANGKDCITEIPLDRWDWRDYYSDDKTTQGAHFSKVGGFIQGVDEFDPKFFKIMPREAMILDPQERMFLQHAWMALEDAGLTREDLQISRDKMLPGQVGVYVGVMYGEYQLFGAEASMRGDRQAFAGSLADIANRVSYVMNLHGPSLTIDTMCSSSLTTVHMAWQDLKLGRTDMAIAGGVNLNLHPNKYLILSSGQYISVKGHCHSFGVDGDGYIPGEGVGAILLKRLSDAERDGEHIYGIIRGSAVNHGGKVNGYTVPNPAAQADVIGQALQQANLNPRHISYIEAHGTGTKLGDPIEIAALTKAFKQGSKAAGHDKDTGYCLVGAAKSNIGHCEPAAGIAGITKVLMQMRHKKIAPSLFSSTLNPHIDFPSTPFEVNQTLKDWQQPVVDGKTVPRIAGISSFGAGGANAHIIISEYEAKVKRETYQSAQYLVPLSARTSEQLKQRAVDLLSFIEQRQSSDIALDIASIAYTLQVGREAMDERLAFLVTSSEDLRAGLQAFVNGEKAIENCFEGQVKKYREGINGFNQDEEILEALDKWFQRKKYSKLLNAWTKGLSLNWRQLYAGGPRPEKLSLPAYPFAKERYWWDGTHIKTHKSLSLSGVGISNSHLHPLVQENTSNLMQQSYHSTLTADLSFLTQGILPVSAMLEMAACAMSLAIDNNGHEANSGQTAVEISHFSAGQPCRITDALRVGMVLLPDSQQDVRFELYGSEDDAVYCQGRVSLLNGQNQPYTRLADWYSQLNVEPQQLKAVDAHFSYSRNDLMLIKLPANAQATDYQIMPGLLEFALEQWLNQGANPSVAAKATAYISQIAKVSYIQNLEGECLIAVKPTSAGLLDIELRNGAGELCAALLGAKVIDLSQAKVSQPPAVNVEAKRQVGQVAPIVSDGEQSVQNNSRELQNNSHELQNNSREPQIREVALKIKLNKENVPQASDSEQEAVLYPINKPDDVTLSDLVDLAGGQNDILDKPLVTLIDAQTLASGSGSGVTGGAVTQKALRLFAKDAGIYSLQIAKGQTQLTPALVSALTQALQQLSGDQQANEQVKVLQIHASENTFLTGDNEAVNQALTSELFSLIKQLPFPVVAVCQGDATGAGLLLAAMCDFMVLSDSANYALGLNGLNSELVSLLQSRFGNGFTKQLLVSSTMTGANWQQKGLTARVLPKDDVLAIAEQLSIDLASRPVKAMKLLKQHLARHQLAILSSISPLDTQVAPTSDAVDIPQSPARYLQLSQPENGVLQVDIVKQSTRYGLKALAGALAKLLQNLPANCKAVLLNSEHENFIPDSSDAVVAENLPVWQQALHQAAVPVVALLTDDMTDGLGGAGWLAALCADVQLYVTDKQYCAAGNWQQQFAIESCDSVFESHFGEGVAHQLLLSGDTYTGLELAQRSGMAECCESEDILKRGVQLAAQITTQSSDFWQQYRGELTPLKAAKHVIVETSAQPQKQRVALQSEVIKAWRYDSGVLLVTMEDREAKNMLSPQTLDGIQELFAHIEASDDYKAVVLTGYDNYFSSGGTKDDLVAIQKGEVKFTDVKVYHLAMACKLPVIAAIQGHAIGAGWALGMFADINFLSSSARYISPYMNLGFTPGAGATFIVPHKLGQDLAYESLMYSNEFDGRELKGRGADLPIMAKGQILDSALALGHKLSRYSLDALLPLKQQWSERHLKGLEDYYERELAMHDETFVGQQDTLEQIERNFNEIGNKNSLATSSPATQAVAPPTAPVAPAASPVESPVASAPKAVSLPTVDNILLELKTSLSTELHMDIEDMDENEQFVDLGLDSIYGVTWIRKINEQFGLDLEAVIVYSYPNLRSFSEFIHEKLAKQTPQQETQVVAPSASAQDAVQVAPVQAAPIQAPAAVISAPAPAQTGPVASSGESADSIMQTLQQMLADELHMSIDEVDTQAQFVDLGLDSIYGVTWIRKINEKYQLDLEAVIIYSYPTLREFSEHISQLLPTESVVNEPATSDAALLAPTPAPAPAPVPAPEIAEQVVAAPAVVAESSVSSNQQNLTQVMAVLRQMLAEELHMPESEVDSQAQFVDLGLDSIYGVTWVRKINEHFGLNIEAVEVYSYPTLEEFSQHVASLSAPAEQAQSVAAAAPAPVNTQAQAVNTQAQAAQAALLSKANDVITLDTGSIAALSSWRSVQGQEQQTARASMLSQSAPMQVKPQAIAIIGMAGQFPKAASVDQFWQNIAQGVNCIDQVPSQRWSLSRYYQEGEPVAGKTNSKWMGSVDGHDLFDPLFFNIAPTEAESMDPQQRLFLQNCWHVVEDAAYSADDLSGSNCGVFVGCAPGDYHSLASQPQTSAQAFTGSSMSILAARISYFMNLQGPSIAVDTACSASLVAIANACDSLNAGNSDMALAGGVCIMSGPKMHLMTAQAGMLSVDGRCHTFDQKANGFVPGEGVGVVLLKRLDDAKRDEDSIHAIIEGWGVNQDGKTNGITAPNPVAQTRLETEVYERFNIDPAQIQLVEAHGTGTKLGDPIEVRALKDTFAKFTDKQQYCALGSVKSNIGHAVTAAGVAGVIKVAKALYHKQLPPTINFTQLNEHIGLDNSPFYINDQLQDWQVAANEKRRGVVSSFGFSGTNAHLVLTEADTTPVPANAAVQLNSSFVIPLSAKTNEQLAQVAANLLSYLNDNSDTSLADLAFTLQVGRTGMSKRVAMICQSLSQLQNQLQSFIANANDKAKDVYYSALLGGVTKSKQPLDTQLHSLAELAQAWAAGSKVNWYSGWPVKGQKLRLPVYPFAKESYWLQESTSQQAASIPAPLSTAKPWLHPLLQANESNFYQQQFSSEFTGHEHFLTDHKVALAADEYVPVLPGMAYLEMARAALQLSLPDISDNIGIENVVWLRPLVVSQAEKVIIKLSPAEQAAGAPQRFEFSIVAGADEDVQSQSTPYCQGQLHIAHNLVAPTLEIAGDLQPLDIEPQALYRKLKAIGLDYGYSHRFITGLNVAQGKVLARLSIPQDIQGQLQDYLLHPGVLDCALQAAAVMPQAGKGEENEASVPFALDRLNILAPCEADMQALVQVAQNSTPGLPKLDISLYDMQGNLCVQMTGFSTRAIVGEEVVGNSHEPVVSHEPANNQLTQDADDAQSQSRYEQILDQILNNQISAEEAAKLG